MPEGFYTPKNQRRKLGEEGVAGGIAPKAYLKNSERVNGESFAGGKEILKQISANYSPSRPLIKLSQVGA